jgi:2-phospho-L-lactate guanylyltransferase
MMEAPNIWAVIPVKAYSRSKNRLAGVLGPSERARLSEAMLVDVLTAVNGSSRLAGVAVVTSDPKVEKTASEHGARVLFEKVDKGPSHAVMSAGHILAREGYGGMLAVMSDVPLISTAEIDQLLQWHGLSPAVTLVQARDGLGTNAVVCSPPAIIKLSFGGASLAAHAVTARMAGIKPGILSLAGFELDVDLPDDLLDFLGQQSDTRTARCLADSNLARTLKEQLEPSTEARDRA